MGEKDKTTPDEQVRALFGDAEKRAAGAMEQLVHRDSFGELLARVTENVMGVTRIGFDVLDLTVRNLRIAGRPDLLRLGRQLARNEDKLELLLQEIERLQDQVRELEGATEAVPKRRSSASRSGGSSSNGSQGRGSKGASNRRSRSGGSRRKSS